MPTLVCLCGLVLHGEPPQTCPRCEVTVTHAATPWRSVPFEQWLAAVRDETGGAASRTPEDPMEAW